MELTRIRSPSISVRLPSGSKDTKAKPLTFLDHRIRCGDSLVGVFDLSVLKNGIPDEAYTAVTGDDKAVARDLKKQNKKEREHRSLTEFDAQ